MLRYIYLLASFNGSGWVASNIKNPHGMCVRFAVPMACAALFCACLGLASAQVNIDRAMARPLSAEGHEFHLGPINSIRGRVS